MSRYYSAYESRYRQVYRQGVEYWADDPRELASATGQLDRFLSAYSLHPDTSVLIEFGCGEGNLARHLVEKGFAYCGIDISESALRKARARIGASDQARFLHGDVLSLSSVRSGSFDAGIDNFCLQMLVVDSDRAAYLSEVLRVIKPGGCAFFHEILQEARYGHRIDSFQDYVALSGFDGTALEAREAYSGGKRTEILLPRVPSRFNDLEGYRDELTGAGFRVERLLDRGHQCVVYARTPPIG